MVPATLFHLHFFSRELRGYEQFLTEQLGFQIQARYSQTGGVLEAGMPWSQIQQQGIKLRLIDLQLGAVNIVLMPGKYEHAQCEHFGLLLSPTDYKVVLERAQDLGLSARENPRRTFLSSKLGFRIEIQIAETLEQDEALRLSRVDFQCQQPNEFKDLMQGLFGFEFDGPRCQIGDTEIVLSEGPFTVREFQCRGPAFEKLGALKVPLGFPFKCSHASA